ncbi:MAG: F0F1 ATP synthase subunit A [Candidatus Daviesbacteria bacterium]|nr:F0F1 ATP synthase subunit A [Candidatus Daviesbacteria bacterium]
MEHQITFAPEVIGYIGSFPLTNTIFVTWITMAILVILSYLATANLKTIPTGLQNFFEFAVEGIYDLVEGLAGLRTKIFFPILATFFLFIVTANWLGLFPGFATIGWTEVHNGQKTFIPLLRSVNTDLNTTLALALVSVVLTHFFSIKYLGIVTYLKHWFSLNPIFLFVGLLELVGEFTKLVSLSFRLFGNIFAGEVVLATVSTIFPLSAFFIPLPFYGLEIIVGVVQGAVFMMLTLVFMVLLTEKHIGEESH